MKKPRFSPKAVLALALTLLLAALPCAVLAEDAPARQDIPLDSEEFQTLLHEVFEANQFDALLEKHTSVIYDMSDAPANDYDWRDYAYNSREVCYIEMPSSSWYESDRVFYVLMDGDKGESQMFYGLNMCTDYDLLRDAGYQIVTDDEAKWANNEGDAHEACYIENGLLVLRDRKYPEAAESWFAEHLPFETYDGEAVYDEVIVDAETKEVLEFNYYLEGKDGEVRRVAHYTATYDAPEPRRMRNMRAAFERYCEHTVDVTMVCDAGTDREFSKTITIPVGSQINYSCDNAGKALACDDPETLEVTHFDGMASKTLYIITDPTDEQTERYQANLQALREAMAAE